MPTEKTLKLTENVHSELMQRKAKLKLKSADQTIHRLLEETK